MASQEYDHQFKMVMVGDSGVGKTNILLRYMSNDYDSNSKTTLGVEFSSKYLTMDDGAKIRAQLWDTAGEERFKTVANIYLKGAVGALLTYSVTSKESFESVQGWLDKLIECTNEGLVVLLVGNKIDLADQREVT